MVQPQGYSLSNARRFDWSSVTGRLNPGRTALLDQSVKGGRVLDAGCGGGAYCQYLADKGLDIVGVDANEEFLGAARSEFPDRDFQIANITSLPFDDNSFDTVVCFDVLEHVDDVAAIAELVRVASQRVVLAVPREGDEMFPFNLTFKPYIDTTHLRYYSRESLGALIDAVIPAATVTIQTELLVPTERLLCHVCDPTLCGYSGLAGAALKCIRILGGNVDNIAMRRGEHILKRLARRTQRPIPTGLTATIDL